MSFMESCVHGTRLTAVSFQPSQRNPSLTATLSNLALNR